MDHPIVIDSAGGEYMETVVVLEWTRAPGERIEAGETIAIVETAKAATEIEASHGGYLKEILVKAGEEAPVGALLGRISDGVELAEEVVAAPVAAIALQPVAFSTAGAPKPSRVVATPLARRIARERGIDLAVVTGTGPAGRIKRRDLEGAAPASKASPPSVAPARPDVAPIVFLHGFGADRSAWRQVTPLLSGGHRVVLIDLPGHGGAPAVPVTGIDDLAFAVADQLQALGIAEAHVVGHSLGGATALALAQLGPVAIKSLCLIAPGGLGPEVDVAFLRGFATASEPEILQPWLDRMTADPARLPAGFARAVLRQRERAGVRAAQQQIIDALFNDGVQGFRLNAALEALDIPVKILWGTKDAIIPSAHARTAPGTVALHFLRDTGHVPQIECPAVVARLIDELIRSQRW